MNARAPFLLLLTTACAAGAPPSLPVVAEAGSWTGQDVQFVVADGSVTALVISKLTCAGTGCTGEAQGPVAGNANAVSGFRLASGDTVVEGTFTSPTRALGTVTATRACCTVKAAWSSQWVPGSGPAKAGADATTASDRAANSETAIGKPGALDWGGASSGTVHPGPSLPFASPAPPQDATQPQQQALSLLNTVRAQVGLQPVQGEVTLNAAAQAHADFYGQYASQYKAKNLSPHEEFAAFGTGYTGKTLPQRLAKAGFSGTPGAEVMAFSGNPASAVQGWIDTVYHRLPLLDPRSKSVGYGQSTKKAACEVMDFGAGAKDPGAIIVYPWPGQTGVPSFWNGLEGPQPKQPPQGYPSGPVVTARLPQPVTVTKHQLFDPKGQDLPHVWLEPANDPYLGAFDANVKVLYAEKPLGKGDHTVRIAFKATQQGAQESVLQWRFKVGN